MPEFRPSVGSMAKYGYLVDFWVQVQIQQPVFILLIIIYFQISLLVKWFLFYTVHVTYCRNNHPQHCEAFFQAHPRGTQFVSSSDFEKVGLIHVYRWRDALYWNAIIIKKHPIYVCRWREALYWNAIIIKKTSITQGSL